ncbi:MAG: flagellar biosynthetic protein FliO [Syntrophales bacterium]|nr:flagellar biosynthetic protein FliO [Syntrophales bacterium]MDD5641052.1 flagellar biosynthetic protein FliO [Syntrophales bacterium]
MVDLGGWIHGGWGWLGVAAQEAAGAAAGSAATAPDFPFWQHLIRVVAVLSGMLGVLILGLYLWKRSGALRSKGVSPLIQVLATHYLAPKKALILVAVGKERLLLASAGEHLHLVTSLAPEAAAAPAATPSLGLPPNNEKEGHG